MTTYLIVNADDFGASASTNSAVAAASSAGLLTSASLMVTGEAVDEAVSMAKADPNLAVGLHLALSDGCRPAAPADKVPDLLRRNGRFISHPASAALHCHFSRKTREQLRTEIEAQFAAFAATGLALSHVDGHQHLHALPSVLPIVIELAHKYGAHGVRLPREPVLLNLCVDISRLGAKIGVAFGHSYLSRAALPMLKHSGLAYCDHSIGALMSGAMCEDYVISILSRLRAERIEVFFHPMDESGVPRVYGPNPGDLQTLLSPDLRRFIADNDYQLTNYAGITSLRQVEGHERV